MSKPKAGGGPASRQVHKTSEPKREPRAKAVDVSTLGRQKAGVGYEFGRETKAIPNKTKATSGSDIGPGGGRTVHRSGSQHSLPPAKPVPAGKDILSSYGPERNRGSR